jgi:hypothetical protein
MNFASVSASAEASSSVNYTAGDENTIRDNYGATDSQSNSPYRNSEAFSPTFNNSKDIKTHLNIINSNMVEKIELKKSSNNSMKSVSVDHTNRPDDLISIASIDNEKEFSVVNLEELSEDRNW